jgi:hypothetical protein
MTPDQFNQLLQVLERIASKQYTITGAADWPILLVLGGLLVSVLGFMWHDLRGQLKDHKDDTRKTSILYGSSNAAAKRTAARAIATKRSHDHRRSGSP